MTLTKAISEIEIEFKDAKRMLDNIQFDPRRKLDRPCEKLHYWDGKCNGLKLALDYLRKVKT